MTVPMIRAVKQIILVLAHGRNLVEERCVNMNVACRARAASATEREQFVDPAVPDDLHHGEPFLAIQDDLFAFTGNHVNLGHYLLRFPYGARYAQVARCLQRR